MKTAASTKPICSRRRSCAAILLVECLVYLAVFFVVTGLAFAALHRTWLAHKALRHNAEDIVAALHAGERWRADIRRATGPIEHHEENGMWIVRIPGADDSVFYLFSHGEVMRSTTNRLSEAVVLRNVKASEMTPDQRSQITAWCWELELKSSRPNAKTRPLFTFTAVAPHPKP